MSTSFLIQVGALLLLSTACQAGSETVATSAEPKSYACRGVVQRLDLNQGRATIHHREVPGYMPEMTMDFNVKRTNELATIPPGSEITFDLRVEQADAWIENIHLVARGKPAETELARSNDGGLKQGEPWPDGELEDEHGASVHFSDFRGQALAVTFFFTRCPLPNYCPLLNKNFSEARRLLSESLEAPTNYSFLSISFDPDFDAPKNLTAYGDDYRARDPDRWLFAVASKDTLGKLPRRLGLLVNRQGAGITHNLRTVVVDPQGRVYRQFDGNNWTSEQLVSAIKEAATQKGNKEESP